MSLSATSAAKRKQNIYGGLMAVDRWPIGDRNKILACSFAQLHVPPAPWRNQRHATLQAVPVFGFPHANGTQPVEPIRIHRRELVWRMLGDCNVGRIRRQCGQYQL